MKRPWIPTSLVAAGAALLSVALLPVALLNTNNAQEQPMRPEQTATFMRLKLDRAKDLMEGIVLEDFDAIAKSSQEISLLTHDENWQVLRSTDYIRLSERFRRTADSVTQAAVNKNIEAAALGYMQMTLDCVACHKYLRDPNQPAETPPPVARPVTRPDDQPDAP
jgi:hypothetical protein